MLCDLVAVGWMGGNVSGGLCDGVGGDACPVEPFRPNRRASGAVVRGGPLLLLPVVAIAPAVATAAVVC